MRSLLLCLALLPMTLRFAAGAVKAETVQFKSGSESVAGYLALPGSPGQHPALIVIQEWWGLNDWIKQQARAFAAQGYVALAPDLYHGQVTSDPGRARELMRSMSSEGAIRDLQSAYAYLAVRSDVNRHKIGAIGWCMGGGLALQLAIHEPRLVACVVNYGQLTTDAAQIAKIHAALLGNFGAEDRGITPDDVHAFEEAMKAEGKSIDVKIYDGAGHAFENPNNQRGYRPKAARDAEARTNAFLLKKLKK